ncbi:MAG: response regulator [Deltaproteobacteria bacterium]|nr:response regulator [Deltaproteobacteria bacterium]
MGRTNPNRLTHIPGACLDVNNDVSEPRPLVVDACPAPPTADSPTIEKTHGSGVNSLEILIVDDCVPFCRTAARLVRRLGHKAEVAHRLAEARSRLALSPGFDIVLVDLKLPDGWGASLLDILGAATPKPIVVVVSGYLDAETALDIAGRCDLTVPKPLACPTILKLVETVTKLRARPLVGAWLRDRYRLSGQEIAVVETASGGKTIKATAAALQCRPCTVIGYWRRVFKKMGCHSQREVLAVVHARTESGGVPT